ncbi:hypothetical protein JCM8208_000466 [Rhodotorula glutinis]
MSLDSLPPEVLAAVASHLPLRTTSVRPHSSLVSLASTSRHLRTALEPAINRTVVLDSPTQALALARHAPTRHRALVRAVHLRSLSSSATPTWTIDHLVHLVRSLSGLTDLHCTALAADPADTLAILAHSGTASRLDHLDLDFAPFPPSCRTSPASPSRTKHTRDPAPAHPVRPASESPSTASRPSTRSAASLAHALGECSLGSTRPVSSSDGVDAGLSTLQAWLRVCLAECPELRTLVLRNLPAAVPSNAASCRAAAPSSLSATEHRQTRLERLELEATELDDAALGEVLGAARRTLDTLRLRRCGGFTGAGLVRAVKAHGARIRHLELVVDEALPGTPSSSAPPRSSPPPPASALAHVVDNILPNLPHLTTLTLSSPASAPHAALISPVALALLPVHAPHLAALHLSGPYSASDILPLVRPAPGAPTLRHLRVVALHRPTPLLGACDAGAASSAHHDDVGGDNDDDPGVQELWAAALQREVRLEGAQFGRARERLEWARGAALDLVRDEPAVVASTRRRKRPSML